ncbi:MAG: CPBP family intramembrane metalloprotease [Planctomycetes bacterium]|nr:CPBP family intramembrane metalloprotease [Planctomycetota bacterium]
MSSCLVAIASVAAAPPSDNAEALGVDWFNVLWVLDWFLVGLGAGVILGAVIVWLRRGRGNPLAMEADRPNHLMPDRAFLPALVFLLAAAGLHMAAERMFAGEVLEGAMWHVGNGAQLIGGLACVWVGAVSFEGGAAVFLLGDRRTGRDLLYGVLYLFASLSICAAVLYATQVLMVRFWPEYPFPEHEAIERLRTGEVPAWTVWLGTVVIAPIAEECFFRGILVTMLRNLLRSRWLVVLLSGAIFGAAHSEQPQVIPALTALGVLLGILYLRTGSLLGPIVLHLLFNFKTMLWETLLGLGR